MGFYIRKSVRVGPLRFNLSSSGIGVSTRIPGNRIGMEPRALTFIWDAAGCITAKLCALIVGVIDGQPLNFRVRGKMHRPSVDYYMKSIFLGAGEQVS